MAKIPEETPEEVAEAPRISLWTRLRPIAYLAAMFVAMNLIFRAFAPKTAEGILYILCSILLLTGGLSAQAQKKPADHGKDMREKVRAEKRAFLMRELSLTAGEVDALMPVLNELDDKRFALWRSTETLGRRVRQGDKTLTEAELNTYLEQMLDFHVREAELERTYYLRCRSTLPAEKLVRLPIVCKDFARRFFERHKR